MKENSGLKTEVSPSGGSDLAAALAVTWSSQVIGTAAIFAVAVLAPEIGPAVNLDPTLIGIFVSIAYLFAQVSGLVTSTYVTRYGPVRVSQATLIFAAIGLGLMVLGQPILILLAAVFLGLNYGPLNPSSALLLSGRAPANRRPLVFSIKQTGVPFAGIAAGAVLPAVALTWGWEVALSSVAVAGLTICILIQPQRKRFDKQASPARRAESKIDMKGPLKLVLQDRRLRGTSLAAFAFAGAQISVASFYVLFLTEEIGLDLLQAGFIFAFVQTGGIAGRIFWGAIADHMISSTAVLVLLAVLVLTGLAGATQMALAWPFWAMAALSFFIGACAFGWNGVLLSDLAKLAPEGRVADATGGSQFIMFGGVTVLPPIFGGAVAVLGGYDLPFVAAGAFVLVLAGYLAMTRRPITKQ